jgi:hypothetical protein
MKREETEMFTNPDYTDIVWALWCHYFLNLSTKLFSFCDIRNKERNMFEPQ